MLVDTTQLLSSYGYWAVGGVIALESMGLPLPGETMLIAAAAYAGATRNLNIWLVIPAAAAGAIVGDNIGFMLGRKLGYPLLTRYRQLLRLSERRVRLGQYLFRYHGSKIVFFSRFVTILRTLAALLAGVNCMAWPRFLIFNAAGAIVWAFGYGFAAYYFGAALKQAYTPIEVGLGIAAAIVIVLAFFAARKLEAKLEQAAEGDVPGSVRPSRRRRR